MSKVEFRKVPVTNNAGYFNIVSNEPSHGCDFTCYASMVEEPQASVVVESLQNRAELDAAREVCQAALLVTDAANAQRAVFDKAYAYGLDNNLRMALSKWRDTQTGSGAAPQRKTER